MRHCLPAQRGFTLLELLVVLAIMAIGSAAVMLTLRNTPEQALTQDAQRLAAWLDTARAQSRVRGERVVCITNAQGFYFTGQSGMALSNELHPWSYARTRSDLQLNAPLVLGPEPMIGPQRVTLYLQDAPQTRVVVATDGLRDFGVLP
jgi:general secretion pathway protein H